MKILLLGAEGQLGSELKLALSVLGELCTLSRKDVDFQDLDAVRRLVVESSADCIVNAVGYTHVDNAEKYPQDAYRVNVEAVGLIAQEAKRLGAWLIHYSTNYVFQGTREHSYIESDPVSPVGVYGQTKYEGEERVRESLCKHIIFRVGYLYSLYGGWSNLLSKMLRRMQGSDALYMVDDQWCVPTSAAFVAGVTALCVYSVFRDAGSERVSGTYHLAPCGVVTWYELALYVVAEAEKCCIPLSRSLKICPVSAQEYPLSPRRPEACILDSRKCVEAFALALPHWSMHFQKTLQDYALVTGFYA